MISALKHSVRNNIKSLFRSTTSEERALWSEVVCRSLLADSEICAAHCIMAFWPLADEPDIRPALLRLHNEGKTILLPEVINDTDMRLRIFNSLPMKKGVLGTQQPQGDVFDDYSGIDVVLVPGMAFDNHGHRLGRGKGYYDRFLPLLPKKSAKIGICYPYQILAEVPYSDYDFQLTKILNPL